MFDQEQLWRDVMFVIDPQGEVCVWLPQPHPVKEVGFIRRELHSAHFVTFTVQDWDEPAKYNLQGYHEWEKELEE